MGKLPTRNSADRKDRGKKDQSGHAQVIVEGDFHYSPNDIAELKKLADAHPDLAKVIVEDRREIAVMDQNTERLGIVVAAILAVSLIIGTSITLVQLGWWQSIMFVGALLGISHVLRTLLKGEFSETNWFGRIMSAAPKPKDKDGS